jgi:hypothetical protein
MEVYPHEEAKTYALSIAVNCYHLDWQVSSAAQISNSLSPMFSAVEHLTLEHSVHTQSSEEHNEADPTDWRKLLRSFRNVKTLRIAEGLVKELSRCLELDDGELPLELLPELQELTYVGSGNTGDKFTSFIDARQDAGRSITLVRRSVQLFWHSVSTHSTIRFSYDVCKITGRCQYSTDVTEKGLTCDEERNVLFRKIWLFQEYEGISKEFRLIRSSIFIRKISLDGRYVWTFRGQHLSGWCQGNGMKRVNTVQNRAGDDGER